MSGSTNRDRLAAAFIAALAADFEKEGANAIAALRADKPVDYLKIVASLTPKDPGNTEETTDDDLRNILGVLEGELARRRGADGPQAA